MSRILPTLTAIVYSACAASSQCPTPPLSLAIGRWAAPSGTVHALVKWDPDGPGPLGVHVVCGGAFGFAGTAVTEHIALFDPATRTFSPLGAGFDAPVRALAVLPNGTLVAGGEFMHSGATAIARVASWSGTAWVGLGAGTDDDVLALVAMLNGDVVAGGRFTTAGSLVTNHIARWNGVAWNGLGGGVSGTIPTSPWFPPPPLVTVVTHLGVRQNGDLVIGGEFTTAGTAAANGIAIWNGTSWTSPIPGPTTNHVVAMHVLANGDVLGSFGNLSATWFVSRWNGTSWWQLGTNAVVRTAFAELANGTLLATFPYGQSGEYGGLEKWNGTSWSSINTPFPCAAGTALLEVAPGDLWMATLGDQFVLASVWRWTGTSWHTPADGLDQVVSDVDVYGDGFAICGTFAQVGSTPAKHIARVANGIVTALGDADGYVGRLTVAANGDLVIGGSLSSVGGVPVTDVARFDGSQWHAMGTPPVIVQAIAAMPNGDILTGGIQVGAGNPLVARWNGSTWTPLGNLATFPFVNVTAVAAMPNNDVVVAFYATAGAKVLRWNGSTWAPLGNGLASASPSDSVIALCVLPNGDLVAGGVFTSGSLTNVARWDGQAWQPMGGGLPSLVSDLDLLPGGDVLATHQHLDLLGQPVASPSIWRGGAWTPIVGIEATANYSARRSAVHPQGLVLVTGSFQSVQGTSAGGLAFLYPGCPAMAISYGIACSGSGGPMALSVTSLAWLGGSYRAHTTGIPASALAVQVFGLAAVTVPLVSLLPQALPGCTLLVSPDVLLADMPTGGAVTTTWTLPMAVSLLGQSFRQQTVSFELTPAGAIQSVSASNAVQVTIGAF